MYRILQADKDCYIQNKWIYSTRSIDANTGLASSLDFYYLYDESTILGLTGYALSKSYKEQTLSLIPICRCRRIEPLTYSATPFH